MTNKPLKFLHGINANGEELRLEFEDKTDFSDFRKWFNPSERLIDGYYNDELKRFKTNREYKESNNPSNYQRIKQFSYQDLYIILQKLTVSKVKKFEENSQLKSSEITKGIQGHILEKDGRWLNGRTINRQRKIERILRKWSQKIIDGKGNQFMLVEHITVGKKRDRDRHRYRLLWFIIIDKQQERNKIPMKSYQYNNIINDINVKENLFQERKILGPDIFPITESSTNFTELPKEIRYNLTNYYFIDLSQDSGSKRLTSIINSIKNRRGIKSRKDIKEVVSLKKTYGSFKGLKPRQILSVYLDKGRIEFIHCLNYLIIIGFEEKIGEISDICKFFDDKGLISDMNYEPTIDTMVDISDKCIRNNPEMINILNKYMASEIKNMKVYETSSGILYKNIKVNTINILVSKCEDHDLVDTYLVSFFPIFQVVKRLFMKYFKIFEKYQLSFDCIISEIDKEGTWTSDKRGIETVISRLMPIVINMYMTKRKLDCLFDNAKHVFEYYKHLSFNEFLEDDFMVLKQLYRNFQKQIDTSNKMKEDIVVFLRSVAK